VASAVDIANQALGQISARATIASFDERSNEARSVRLFYADTLDALLRAAPWNFCRRTAYLTLLKAAPGTPENPTAGPGYWTPDQPPPPWLYSYFLPTNCVKFRFVMPQVSQGGITGTPIFSVPSFVPVPLYAAQAQKFVLGTDTDTGGNEVTTISTNQNTAIGVWNHRVENPDLWDASFKQAMIDSLATRLAMPISGDKATAQMVKGWAQSAMGTINVARANDGNEGLTQDNHVPDWLRVRGFAGDWTTAGNNGFWDTPSFLVL
jgi:hypothetical protein